MSKQQFCIHCGQTRYTLIKGRCKTCADYFKKHGEDRELRYRDQRGNFCDCGNYATNKNVEVEFGGVIEYFNLCDTCMGYEIELEEDDWASVPAPQPHHVGTLFGITTTTRYPVRVR